jgi:hypothetical protein
MKQDDLEYIIANHKWRLTWRDILGRYYIMLFPAFLLFISVEMPFGIGFVRPVIIFSLFILPFSLYFFYDINKRITAERTFFFIASSACQKETVESFVNELGWTTTLSTKEYLQARAKLSWTSWGEVITIIYLDNQILFNSRPDSQPFTSDRDDVNFRKLFELVTEREQGLLLTKRL